MTDHLKPNKAITRFLRLLISGGKCELVGERFAVRRSGSKASLPVAEVHRLVSVGLIECSENTCKARPEARAWLKRQMADEDQAAAQHRTVVAGPDGVALNLAESPLGRLAVPVKGNPPFLARHQLEAGERVRHLYERANLVQRTTMSYDPSRVASAGGGNRSGPVSDLAIDARASLNRLIAALPADCAGVVMDVCGHLKGLQQVETERQWPRRSAKLVLRIGLEQAAMVFGLSQTATGAQNSRDHNWMETGARPSEIG